MLIYGALANQFVILGPALSVILTLNGVKRKNLTLLRTGSAKNPETLSLRFTQGQVDK